jgi:hypothetical protein
VKGKISLLLRDEISQVVRHLRFKQGLADFEAHPVEYLEKVVGEEPGAVRAALFPVTVSDFPSFVEVEQTVVPGQACVLEPDLAV